MDLQRYEEGGSYVYLLYDSDGETVHILEPPRPDKSGTIWLGGYATNRRDLALALRNNFKRLARSVDESK